MTERPTSSSAAPAAPCGAMALLDKFGKINSAIDDTRRKNAEATSALERTRGKIDEVRADREAMTAERDRATEEMQALNVEVREAESILDDARRGGGGSASALKERDDAVRAHGMARRYAEEARANFLAGCREFRSTCKRLRLGAIDHSDGGGFASPSSGDAGGTDEFPSTSHEYGSSDREGSSDLYEGETGETGCESSLPIGAECINGHTKSFKMLLKQKRQRRKKSSDDTKVCDDDDMQIARRRHTVALEAKSTAKTGLDDAKEEHTRATERSDDRSHKLERAKTQLQRVRREVESLGTELEKLDHETREARAMGDAYAKDACRRKRNQSKRSTFAFTVQQPTPGGTGERRYTPARDTYEGVFTARNDHSRQGRVTPSPHIPNSGNRFSEFSATSSAEQSAVTMGQNQAFQLSQSDTASKKSVSIGNPYNKGGSQRERGFSTTAIPDEGNGRRRETIEQQHPHRAGRVRVNRQFSTAMQIISGGYADDTGKTSTDISQPPRSIPMPNSPDTWTSTTNRRGGGSEQSAGEKESEDDDDCDDLLSFVAFRKKPRA